MSKNSKKRVIHVCAGRPYGHVPGHTYRDCEVSVYQTAHGFMAKAVLSWGSAQGRDEEHGRLEALETGSTAYNAVRNLKGEALAMVRADTSDDEDVGYVRTAIARAMEKAMEL